jgi:hypothetical protein
VALQVIADATAPPKVTVLLPGVDPKLLPLIVTDVPIGPEAGERVVIWGFTVKETELLAAPLTVITTLAAPGKRPLGTLATILATPQLVTVAVAPPKVSVLVPCVEPKFVPVIVTEVPIGPEVGDRLLIDGVGITVNALPLLFTPLA